MTFSSKCKNEITRLNFDKECCMIAEFTALIRTICSISIKGLNEYYLEFTTENAAIARRVFKLIKTLYLINCEIKVNKTNRLKKRNNYIVVVDDGEIIKNILLNTMLSEGEDINILDFNYGIPRGIIKSDCCRRSYLRGCFLGCGSISDPERSYHLEFVSYRKIHSKNLETLLNKYDLGAKTIERKDYYVTYIKDSEKIIDLLNIVGAHNSLLSIENIKAMRETRNIINRVINCETANLDKIVDAAVRQKNSIQILKKYNAIDTLPDGLKELAYLRLEHEQASLKELGEMMDPKLSKSGVNHRLKKIENIAQEVMDGNKN